MKKIILLAILLILATFITYRFFYNKNRISQLHYGVKANETRKMLKVPIIDNYMKAVYRHNQYFGNRWESNQELPSSNEVLHVWKIVTPLSDTAGLYNESDAFRKRFSDSLVYQLNITSKIMGDTVAIRSGKFFFYNRTSLLDIDLDESKIDSIANLWGLINLIRNR